MAPRGLSIWWNQYSLRSCGFQGPLSLQLAGFMVRCHYSWRVSGSGVEWVTVIFGRSPPPGGEAPSVVGLVMSVRPCIHPKP